MNETARPSPDRNRRLFGSRPVRRQGMTLTEVAVASAILVVAVIPILRALTIAQTMGATIEHGTQSVILAQGKLDEIRARCLHHYTDSFRENSARLARSYLCSVTDDQDPDLRQIEVAVGYDGDSDGRLSDGEIKVRLSTYIARMR